MISAIIVNTSQECNLGCPHCDYFHNRRNLRQPSSSGGDKPCVMTLDTAYKMFERVAEYVGKHENHGFFHFHWHGGEPLLAPKGYYEELIALQKQVLPAHVKVSNKLSTNGTLLDDDWIEEFDRSGIRLSLSLDGPQKIHDSHRRFRNGKGSYELVIAAVERLLKKDVQFDVLTVIHPEGDGAEILEHHASLGIHQLDFRLPVRSYRTSTVHYELDISHEKSLSQYLIHAFDWWFQQGFRNSVSVRSFEGALRQAIRYSPRVCTWSGKCDPGLITVEPDGRLGLCENLSVCDSYNTTGYHVENIGALSAIDKLPSFRKLRDGGCLPQECDECGVRHLCNGSCPVHRYDIIDGKPGFDQRPAIYCNVIKSLYRHILERLSESVARRVGEVILAS